MSWLALLIFGLISAAGAVTSGVISSAAQKKANEVNKELTESTNQANKEAVESTNKTNVELAEKEMAFNSAEAQKAREFEAEQANTAIQRRAADYEAAGFNPMLAIGSPAQLASGYAASASSVRAQAPQAQAPHVEAVTGMADAMRSVSSIAQSAVTMMLISKMSQDRANIYANSNNYRTDKFYDARMAQRTRTFFDKNANYRGAWSDVFRR